MATRLYLTNVGSSLSVSADASWENNPITSLDRRRLMLPARVGSPFAQYTNNFGTAGQDSILIQFASLPLAAQTVSGNVKAIIRASEAATNGDFRSQMNIRIVGWEGNVFRGTLLAHGTGALASEWATTLTNRKFPVNYAGAGGALTPVAAQLGDRLVVEVGFRCHGTNTNGTIDIGDASLTDLAEDEVGTAQDNPWIEFDNDLVFAEDWSGRRASGSNYLSRLGRFDQAGPEGYAESYALFGGIVEGSRTDIVRRGHTRALTQSSGQTIGQPIYYGSEPGLVEGGRTTTLRSPIGGGGFPSGSSAVEKFKMRALANPGPGYVTWVVSGTPDFAGVQAPGAIQPGTVVVSDYWTEV